MDFELSEDEVALQDGVRKLCEGRFTMERVRATESTGGVDREGWRDLADAGVFALRVPEGDGGVGLGMKEAVLVFEELGRALVPGPLVGSHLAAATVDGAADGSTIVGAVEAGDEPLLVENRDALDVLLLVRDDGAFALDPGALDVEPVARPLDPLTPLHRVTGDVAQGEQVAGPDVVARWRLEGAALVAALQLGIAEATTDLAVAYAKERQQFDKPIGSFQAVKHMCADMLVRTEVARAAVYAAGVTLDDPDVGDPERAVHAAKVNAGEAAVRNGKACIQVHGGMGFTWEVDAHLYLKRAWLLDTVLGSVAEHAEAIATAL
ncbi:MAG TPA: acyl-CoA dehydrogenase family protein [Acidimicrobiia bacterium]|nr:acyl-CoA dehydrogenase family protein [Acidimicrobiia bacterium]